MNNQRGYIERIVALFVFVIAYSLTAYTFESDMCLHLFSDTMDVIERAVNRARNVEFNPDQLVEQYPDIEKTYQNVVARIVPSNQPLLSIVIPAYKEAARLPESLVKIQRFFDRYPLPVEVLVIVEKSPDFTWDIGNKLVEGDSRIQVIDNQVKKGKGYAVRSGMLRAQGKYAIFMDADLSTPLPEVLNFLLQLQTKPNVDVLIGDRRSQADPDEQHRSIFRRALSYGFNKLVQLVSVDGISDTQCGFKAFTLEATKKIFGHQSINGFAFDVEVLVLAEELGYNIVAQPVQWYDDDRSTVNPIWDPLKMARDLVQIRGIVRNNLRSRPEQTPALQPQRPAAAGVPRGSI